MAELNFEIEPLDINIAKLQFTFINELKKENIKFPLVNLFENNDTTLAISGVKVICALDKNNKDKLVLDVDVLDVKKEKSYVYTLASGAKQDILSFLNKQDFLMMIKELVFSVDKKSKS